MSNGIKAANQRRVLFANFGGLGNGVAVAGLFRALDSTGAGWTYYHNECPGLDDLSFLAVANLQGFGGLYPSAWRRFARADWQDIMAFVGYNNIDTVINLRNEGPARDVDYGAFKRAFSSRLKFFDLNGLYAHGVVNYGNLFAQQYALVRAAGPAVCIRHDWLRTDFPIPTIPGPLVLVPSSSQAVKNWPIARWQELALWLHDQHAVEVVVTAGVLPHEKTHANLLAAGVLSARPAARLRVDEAGSVLGLVDTLGNASLVITNDTAAVHIAAALAVPAVGLYFSTDGAIWGGLSPHFVPVQSRTGLLCPEQKPGAGNCLRFHGMCDAPCKDEITVSRVVHAVERVLGARPCGGPRPSTAQQTSDGILNA